MAETDSRFSAKILVLLGDFFQKSKPSSSRSNKNPNHHRLVHCIKWVYQCGCNCTVACTLKQCVLPLTQENPGYGRELILAIAILPYCQVATDTAQQWLMANATGKPFSLDIL